MADDEKPWIIWREPGWYDDLDYPPRRRPASIAIWAEVQRRLAEADDDA